MRSKQDGEFVVVIIYGPSCGSFGLGCIIIPWHQKAWRPGITPGFPKPWDPGRDNNSLSQTSRGCASLLDSLALMQLRWCNTDSTLRPEYKRHVWKVDATTVLSSRQQCYRQTIIILVTSAQPSTGTGEDRRSITSSDRTQCG